MRDLCALAIVVTSWALYGAGSHQSDWRVLVGAALAGGGLLVIRRPRRCDNESVDADV